MAHPSSGTVFLLQERFSRDALAVDAEQHHGFPASRPTTPWGMREP
jgi:hypothetical protein